MKEARNERTVTYGLRDRRSGEILRVESRTDPVEDFGVPSTETSYSLSTDPDHPYFTAASAEEVSRLFAATSPGSSRHTPYMGSYEPHHLEPVAIEEVVTRAIRPTGLPFDMPLRLDLRYAVDIDRGLARDVDGLGEVIEAFEACKDDLSRVPYMGSTRGWGRVSMTGLVTAGAPDAQPEEVEGRIVMDTDGGVSARRALVALPLPEGLAHLLHRQGRPTPAEGCLLVVLGDSRPLPESMLQVLADLRAGSAPKP